MMALGAVGIVSSGGFYFAVFFGVYIGGILIFLRGIFLVFYFG